MRRTDFMHYALCIMHYATLFHPVDQADHQSTLEGDVIAGPDKPEFPDSHGKDKKELADSHKERPIDNPSAHEGVPITPERLQKLWVELLHVYDELKGIKWRWQSLDSSSVKAPLGGKRPAPTPPTGASSGRRGIS